MNQIDEYKTFKDLGRRPTHGPDYKRINMHFVGDIKHDHCIKARVVAGEHLTEPSREKSTLV